MKENRAINETVSKVRPTVISNILGDMYGDVMENVSKDFSDKYIRRSELELLVKI